MLKEIKIKVRNGDVELEMAASIDEVPGAIAVLREFLHTPPEKGGGSAPISVPQEHKPSENPVEEEFMKKVEERFMKYKNPIKLSARQLNWFNKLKQTHTVRLGHIEAVQWKEEK